MTRNAAVAEMVRRRCPDADLLLEMLGVEVDGVMQPDDDRDYGDVDTAQLGPHAKSERSAGVFDYLHVKPSTSTAPEALRNLPTAVVAPHVGRLPLAKCPSKPARKRHRRHNQSCDICGVTAT